MCDVYVDVIADLRGALCVCETDKTTSSAFRVKWVMPMDKRYMTM